jgi:histidinol-phosphate aminotransferase
MTNRFLDITAPGVRSLKPYVPGKPVSELERELGISQSIKLASNENPLGPSPTVEHVLDRHWRGLARYPDGGGFALREAIARRHDVSRDCVTLGNGSNDVLDMIARTFLGPGFESLFSQHAFAVYPISSQAVGAALKVVPAVDYGHDLEAMAAAVSPATRVVWVANPNNPTGTWVGSAALRRFVEGLPEQVIVVVDEAYAEYVMEPDYPDVTIWLADFPNLVVTRTFSKAFGLAGLRIGYGVSHPEIAELLNRVRQPFNANLLAQEAALAALADDEHLRRSVDLNREGLRQLEQGVRALGLDYIPSVGNFLTVDLGRDAGPVDHGLLRLGVITRPIAGYGLPNHLRISVGLPEENAQCLEALARVLAR